VRFLLDTNVLVDHLRGKKLLDKKVIQLGSGVSIITKAELYYGLYKTNADTSEFDRLNMEFSWLSLEVFKLDEEIVNIFGLLKAYLGRKGMRLEDFDLLIASTAMVLNLILVTNNKKHFRRIPKLKLY